MLSIIFGILVLIILAIIALLMTSIKQILPYEEGILIVLGDFKRKLGPGINFVPPLVSSVIKINIQSQPLEVPITEFISKDNNIFNISARATIKVIDTAKAYFEVRNYKLDTIYLIQKVLKSHINEMYHKDISFKNLKLESEIKYDVNRESKSWGVKVEDIKIDKIDMISKGKKGKAMANKRNLEIQLRDILTKHTENFGITVEKIEIKI